MESSKKTDDSQRESVLTSKGYRIPYNDTHFKLIKSELTVKPFVLPDYDFGNKPFPVYRKNEKYIYLPKFYGIEKYGIPNKFEERMGTSVKLQFKGTLKPQQLEIAKTTIDHINMNDSCVLSIPCGAGKCLAYDTPVLMYDGNIKCVQDINIGDKIMGDDSTPRNILSLARGQEEMFEIRPTKGESYTVNKSHILSLKYNTGKKKNEIIDISVEEFLKLPKWYHGRANPLVGFRVPVHFEEKELPIDPYLIGLWLGDGASHHSAISNQDSTVLKYLINKLPEYGCYLRYTGDQYDYRINGSCKKGKNNINFFWNTIKSLDLKTNKHIPRIYKCNSRENRLKILAGLLDTDGYLVHSKAGYEIIQKNTRLAEDIKYLCRSLGFSCYNKKSVKSCMYKGLKKEGIYNRLTIYGFGIEEIPCKIPRKKAQPRKQIKNPLNYGFKVISVGSGDYYGFEIDGNRRFVLGTFDVTHNTVLGLYIAAKLKKKTLVIVHKEFLLNQWVERIEQFLPGARIGVIQQNKVDIEDKDIVIAMVQSIVSRKYPKETFDSFSFTIGDEIHRICSRTFSQALYYISTKYSLGLSATPERKDGLTKILKWFLGEIITPMVGDTKYETSVRLVTAEYFETPEVKYNIRGKVNLPNLVTQVSEDPGRNKQIVEEVIKCLAEDRKILIMTERRNQCYELEKMILARNITESVGIYIGGMKEEAMKESNTKDVIIVTYSMCAEGYDNKKMDTLIMATGRSDIQQICGRIMRQNNPNNPLIVDFQDNLEGLRGQAKKREKYYVKCGYMKPKRKVTTVTREPMFLEE